MHISLHSLAHHSLLRSRSLPRRTCITTNAYQNKLFCSYINHSLYQFRSDGKTMSGIYLGNSTVADPMGQTMVIAENVETMLVADCVPEAYPPRHPEVRRECNSFRCFFVSSFVLNVFSPPLLVSIMFQQGQSDFIRDRRPSLFGALTSTDVVHNVLQASYHYPEDPNEGTDDGSTARAQ